MVYLEEMLQYLYSLYEPNLWHFLSGPYQTFLKYPCEKLAELIPEFFFLFNWLIATASESRFM